MDPTADHHPPRRTAKRPAGDEDDDHHHHQQQLPKKKPRKHHGRNLPGTPAGGSAWERIDGLVTPELARARRARHRRETTAAADDDDEEEAALRLELETTDAADGPEGFGFVDEDGYFVDPPAPRGVSRQDAWLGTAAADEPPAAATAIAKQIRKQRCKKEEEDELLDGLVSSRQVREIKGRVAAMLEPGETVPRALRRIKSSGTAGGGRGGGRMDEAARRAFDELTDAASDLVARGDLGAYSDRREAFARAAAAAAGPEVEEANSDHAGWATGTTDNNDNCLDMFGHEDDEDGAGGEKSAAGSTTAPAGDGEDALGADYVYDPASGYYYSGSTGHYYDAALGATTRRPLAHGSSSTNHEFFMLESPPVQRQSANPELRRGTTTKPSFNHASG